MQKNIHFLYQILASITATLSMFSTGIHEAWTSVYIPKLLNDTETIQITSNEGSWITLFLGIGGLIGCIITSLLTDKIGRKNTILITSFPFFLSSIMLAYAKSVLVFCIARIIAGLASGMTVGVIPHYLSEIASPEIRGMLGTMVTIFNLIGLLYINILGYYVPIITSSLISCIVPLALILSFFWMPESPYYLVMVGRFDDAQKSLKKLSNNREEFNRIADTVMMQRRNPGRISEIFTKKSNRKALLITFILLNGKQFTGIGPIDAYAQLIFEQIFQMSPLLITVIYYSTRLVMVIICSFVTDRIGRRPLLLFSFFGSALTLLFLAIFLYIKTNTSIDVSEFSILPFIFLEGYAVFYSFLTSVPLLMLSELFPMNVKAFASILYEVYMYFSTTVVIKCFQVLTDSFGMEISFLMFAISCILHLVLIYVYVLETKGKSLDEIQKCLH